ncbi:MAG: lipopolysaccharide biosynthesis protein [Pelotomaculum sp.]
MGKYKYLAKNTLVFFIGSFTSKILVFLLLPLYTTVLSASEYAITDLMSISANLLYMILTLMISEAVLRFSIEKRYDKSEVLNIGIVLIIVSSLMVGFGILIASRMNFIKLFDGYWLQFFLLYFFVSINHLLAGFIRGIEKIKLIAIAGVIGTVITIVSNILLLVVFEWGIDGYITSIILANIAVCLIYILFGRIYAYLNIKSFNSNLMVEMTKYSSPIVITEVAWWLNTAADRYMVTWLLGPTETGLLSVAHRLPSVLTIFTSIFMQAWKLSAIKEYESESSQKFFSEMLNLYNALLIVAGAVVIVFVKPISSLIFKGDFASAWYLVPPFILAFVINGVSAFLGTFFIANKNTKSLMYSTLLGAAVNIGLAVVLIQEIGTLGAGIATVVSYFIISSIRIIQVKKQMKLHVEFKRIIPSYLLLLSLTACISMEIKSVAITLLLLVFLIMLNGKHMGRIIKLGVTLINQKWRKYYG